MYPATKSTGIKHNILKAKNTFPINFICFAPYVLLFVSKTMATIIDTTASIAIATANIQNRIIVGVFSIISTSLRKSRTIDHRPYGFYCCPCVFCNTPNYEKPVNLLRHCETSTHTGCGNPHPHSCPLKERIATSLRSSQ